MPRITPINCVIFLLCQLYFSTLIDAQDDILRTTINDGGTKIHLEWKKNKQLLANENLPVWIAQHNLDDDTIGHELKPDFIKENIGEFVMYHDLEKSSAVVYFKKTQTLYGFIDTRYTIKELPLAELDKGPSVGQKYIQFHENPVGEHEKPDDYEHSNSKKRRTDSYRDSIYNRDADSPKSSCRPDNIDEHGTIALYPEILVLVPYHIVKFKKQKRAEYLVDIITENIIFFNAVDMLYAKLPLKDIKIYINIAGFVIDDADIIPIERDYSSNGMTSRIVDVGRTLEYTQSYLNLYKDVLVADSFDFFFTFTFYSMVADNKSHVGMGSPTDVYRSRLNPLHLSGVPGFMVQRHLFTYDFTIAAHEIGHLLLIDHDGDDEGFSDSSVRCSSIMQTTGGACPDCLRWSDTSIQYLRKYVKESRNRCYLLNLPRSLHPYGYPVQTLLPSEQCNCYGFKFYKSDNEPFPDAVSPTDCDRNMKCGQESTEEKVPSPLDGTPCGTGKVCWDKMCAAIQVIP